jgi:hypothetical protein
MRIHTVKKSVFGLLALSLGLLAGRSTFSAPDEDDKKATAAAREAVIGLAQGKGDARSISEKHALEHVMNGFKLRTKGGIGVGSQGDGIKPDGIESKIQALTKGKMSPDDLRAQGPALIKMIQITRAIGDISAFYPDPAKKDPEAWKKFNEDMIKATKDVQDAIKGNDPTKLKKSVSMLNTSCNECHEKFR